jgi:flavin-dependent dehydrogenase
VPAGITPVLSPDGAAGRAWDALVIGAGPAGSAAAIGLARGGAATLLVDRASLPRSKVCGCCLNTAALGVLGALGLGGMPARVGAVPLQAVRVASGGVCARIPLPPAAALSRESLDTELVREAVRSGACFVPGVVARVMPPTAEACLVMLGSAGAAQARVVVVADGLGGRSADGFPGLEVRVWKRSRIGAGVVLDSGPDWVKPGVVYMACGKGGYVGLVRLEDGRVDVAAALDPLFVRSRHGPGAAASEVLAGAGWTPPEVLAASRWRGTPALSRRRCVQSGRVFVVGDACGYVEPFTGEGIAWSLTTGVAVVPHVLAVLAGADAGRSTWVGCYRRLLGGRHRACRSTAWVLRRPMLVRAALRVFSVAPWASRPVVPGFTAGCTAAACQGGAT